MRGPLGCLTRDEASHAAWHESVKTSSARTKLTPISVGPSVSGGATRRRRPARPIARPIARRGVRGGALLGAQLRALVSPPLWLDVSALTPRHLGLIATRPIAASVLPAAVTTAIATAQGASAPTTVPVAASLLFAPPCRWAGAVSDRTPLEPLALR
mmetsp:Transcript_39667/g.92724  ORF Transcript_39667/g.92724 Transcript_39667/m.92724 type:complete len:157 (+) Transcript_39667:345-815(+)